MILIKPSFEIIDKSAYPSILEFIEHIGRVCYKSEDKIGPGTAEKFVKPRIKDGHESILEHGTFCFELSHSEIENDGVLDYIEHSLQCIHDIQENSIGFQFLTRKDWSMLLSFNIRTLRDATKMSPGNPLIYGLTTELSKEYPSLFRDLVILRPSCNAFQLRRILPSEMFKTFTTDELRKHYYETVRFICDRGVSHELVRHRLCAFSQESTRYCNYAGGVTFIIPPWVDIEPGEYNEEIMGAYNDPFTANEVWSFAMLEVEDDYIRLTKSEGWSPQQARSVLPNSLKTEIVVTANLAEWHHIFGLRTAKAAHPQMRELMIPLCSEFKNKFPEIFGDIEL